MSTLAERQPESRVAGIERVPGRCGGYPVIAGTRISVRNVVEQMRVNEWTLDEFHRQFPHLRRDQIEAALVYYARNPEIVDEDIRRHRAAYNAGAGSGEHGDRAVP